ncbi:hypothetical protein R4575_17995, partial [Acinetobacter baumannii]|nr:hypothetical protein [Acinetobacter baumannii]
KGEYQSSKSGLMIKFFTFFIALALSSSSNAAFLNTPYVYKEKTECKEMVQYALLKHQEYAKGKSIEALTNEEALTKDTKEQKDFKTEIISVLDTFAVWEEEAEKQRVQEEIKEYFYSICDPTRAKIIFKKVIK